MTEKRRHVGDRVRVNGELLVPCSVGAVLLAVLVWCGVVWCGVLLTSWIERRMWLRVGHGAAESESVVTNKASEEQLSCGDEQLETRSS